MKKRLRNDLRIPSQKLRYRLNPRKLKFSDTSEVRPSIGFIGQEKATKALQFGLEIEAPGYNIFVTGVPNTGRTSLIHRYLQDFVRNRRDKAVNLKDICYVYSFDYPEKPKLLILKRGEGEKLEIQMQAALKLLQEEIPAIDQSKEFLEAKDKIKADFQAATKQLDEELQRQIKENKLLYLNTPGGRFTIVPMSLVDETKPMPAEEFKNLSPEQKEEFRQKMEKVKKLIEEQDLQIEQLQQELNNKIKQIREELIKTRCLKPIFDYLFGHQNAAVQEYLKQLADWVMNNLNLFVRQQEGMQIFMGMPIQNGNHQDKFIPFRVNILVNNSKQELPPIILENHPTFAGLFGRIEKRFVQGVYVTDHTFIKPGSLILADGGYLILDVLDLLRNPGVWEKLKKSLATGFLKIEDVYEYFGVTHVTVEPEQIPINVKVVVICNPTIYQLLTIYDPDFLDVFKVKVEFNDRMDLNRNNFKNYARFIAFWCQKESLLPFVKTAVAKVIEYGIRLVDDQKKISAQFGKIKDLIIESNYWAKKANAEKVDAIHVQKAIEAQHKRSNLDEEKYQEVINRGVLLIDTQGEKVGQVNGLAVCGDPGFGHPAKITAQTFAGKKGIVSIQREVGLAGPIHNTGVMILSAYLSAKYAQNKPLSLSASICFEQNYGGIEGDSATAAETVALISDLANIPIDQSLAITGSMNQKGEIQPIGGVNEKIEGFFDICRKRGLTGEQGVIIPYQNLDKLMLREDVVKTVRKGLFQIYAIRTIDEAIELLTNRPADEAHRLSLKRLKMIARKIKQTEQEEENHKEDQ